MPALSAAAAPGRGRDDANAGRVERPQNLRRPIFAPIVDHDDLHRAAVALTLDAGEDFANPSLAVSNGDDEADRGTSLRCGALWTLVLSHVGSFPLW